MSWFHRARTRLRMLFARDATEARMEEEFRFHLEMETERLVREEGLDAAEARRRALLAFGDMNEHREALRKGRSLAWFGGVTLDLKLGYRMLVRYPGLTVVGGIAMAFAVWVGVVAFEMVGVAVSPSLPLPDGDRVVQIENFNVETGSEEPRALHDFRVWRDALGSVTDLGAWRDVTHNLIGDDGDARPTVAAEVTASAFLIAPDRPVLGRTLMASDQQPGAPPVVLLGHGVWQRRFSADPEVVGRTVQLGEAYATVVGVMPEGFAFPVFHELWTPFRMEALDQGPLSGPPVTIFGRLSPGATIEAAQAELAGLGQRAAAENPETHEHLQPQIQPYTGVFFSPSGAERGMLLSINIFGLMLLVLICGNVALLLFARAATREGEIVVRSALGASRRRIVMQLFAEALVLTGVATVVGLAAAGYGLEAWGTPFLERNIGRLPFWIDPQLSPVAVGYALVLAVAGATIAGVLPALKVTRGLGGRLREGSVGAGGLRFGGVWTAVIIAQVAVTVACPSIAFLAQQEMVRMKSVVPAFDTDEYLGVRLDMDPPTEAEGDPAAHGARFGAVLESLRQRLEAEAAVQGVTFVDKLPLMTHGWDRLALDDAEQSVHIVATALVDPSYFQVLQTPIVAGRGFSAVDGGPDARVVIVDRAFVDRVLKGGNALGQRARLAEGQELAAGEADPSLPWYEIVGVVEELGMGTVSQNVRPAGIYLPATPGEIAPRAGEVHMMIHAPGGPMEVLPRLRTIATSVDPTLRLADIQRVDEVSNAVLWITGMWLRITLGLTAVAVLLSLAGIYAVLSFTVARRTREIGVRVALGASPRVVVAAIFRRPLTQVGLGVMAGAILIALGAFGLAGHTPDQGFSLQDAGGISPMRWALLGTHTAVMFGVCMLACLVPTRRALNVEPSEALRQD